MQYNQKVNRILVYNDPKIHIWLKKARVLEILISKTLDKTVFMGYNVAIILFYWIDEFLFNEMNVYAFTKNEYLHKQESITLFNYLVYIGEWRCI